MPTISVLAPAKINLSLAIVGRLSTGFHLVHSLIAPLSLYDRIDVCFREGSGQILLKCGYTKELEEHVKAVTSRFPELSPQLEGLHSSSNLVVRAARALLRDTPYDLEITLHKAIPFLAGLGGGSSDAAQLLYALNFALGLDKTRRELYEIGAKLGSDMTATMCDGLTYVYHTGNEFSELGELTSQLMPTLLGCWVVILKPVECVVTKLAYRDFREANPTLPEYDEGEYRQLSNYMVKRQLSQLGSIGKGPKNQFEFDDLTRLLRNDFEPTVFSRYREVEQGVTELKSRGVRDVLLAGSGSALLGFVQSAAQAREVVSSLQTLAKAGWFVSSGKFIEDVRSWAVAKW